MTRVLLLGLDPETVDFSDPALPPGMTAEKVHAGIAVALKQFAERGWEADVGLIRPDETAGPTVERQLASKSYDCVVVGAGVRLPPRGLALFGSPQESDERRILGGFPENDEFGLGDRHALYFQQEIAEVAIAPPAAQQGFDVAINGLDHSHGHFHAAVV